MLNGCEMEIVNLNDLQQFRETQDFMRQFGSTFERDVEYTINFRRDGKIMGSGSFTGEVLYNIGVDKGMQGFGLVETIVSELIQELARRGRFHSFLFTRTSISHVYERLGFEEIAHAEPNVSLLESGMESLPTYCNQLIKRIGHSEGDRAAIFLTSLDHEEKLLIEQAVEENDVVIVFPMKRDQSLISITNLYTDRVVPAGKYIFSPEVLPTCLVRKEDQLVTRTRLDINLFAKQIAPRLGIKRCYGGDDSHSTITEAYTQAMLDILPDYGIEVKIFHLENQQ